MSAQVRDGFPILPGALLALLVGLGLFVGRPTLQSSRPSSSITTKVDPSLTTGFRSRQWQDPLEAISEPKKNGMQWPYLRTAQQETWNELNSQGHSANSTLFLPVLLNGSGLPEFTENRLRARYAVVSALNVSGYSALDAHRLWGARSGEECLAYEWFVHSEQSQRSAESAPAPQKSKPDRVLVLWLDENRFTKKKLATLRNDLSKDPNATIRFIGPTSSDNILLVDSLRDAVYSPWVTAPALRLPEGGSFYRTVAGDDATIRKLVDELERRDVLHDIVIMSESDTKYGRSIASQFIAAVDAKRPVSDHSKDHAFDCQPKVYHYEFMRGMDGLKSAPPRSDASSPQSATRRELDDPREADRRRAESPRAEGPSQSDFLQRLEKELLKKNRELSMSCGKRIRAIGVFGSDVYDKLLALRALKNSFPHVVFFTTDLDDRLSHPAELGWTRNLVVASSFGLRLADHLQGAAMPFRDSYQTSCFYATLLALKAAPPETIDPQLFEISRYGAYPLDRYCCKNCSHSPHPIERLGVSPRVWIVGAIVTPLSVILLLLLTDPVRRRLAEMRRASGAFLPNPRRLRAYFFSGLNLDMPTKLALKRFTQRFTRRSWLYWSRSNWAWWLIFTALFLCVVVAAAVDHCLPGGEPFALIAGISIWPTQFLRLLALLLAIAFILITRKRLHRLSLVTWRKYFRGVRCRRECDSQPLLFSHLLKPEYPDCKPEALWLTLWRVRSTPARMIRVLLLTASFLLISYLWFCVLGSPQTPGRSELSRVMNKLVLIPCVVAQFFLLFLVLDTTGMCEWFVRNLLAGIRADRTFNPNTWRQDYLVETANRLGLLTGDHWWVDCLLRFRVTAEMTAVIDKTIYFPFIVFFVMILSRHSIFDAWDWPIPLVTVFTVGFLCAIYAAVTLRLSAQLARNEILPMLREAIMVAHVDGPPARVTRLEAIADEIANERRGAFSRLSDNPVLKAVLIPTGGLGTLALVEGLVNLTW